MSLLLAASIASFLVLVVAPGGGLIGAPAAQAGPAKQAGDSGAGKGAAVPECGTGRPEECHIDVTVRQGPPTAGAVCSSFDDGEGFCVGSSTGNTGWTEPGYFPRQGIGASFTWKGGSPRDVDYTANATFTIVEAFIRGNVPSGGSATFNVTDAYNRGSDAHWKTVSRGGAPGTPGGPLYIDYEHKFVGSYVHMYGYLVRK